MRVGSCTVWDVKRLRGRDFDGRSAAERCVVALVAYALVASAILALLLLCFAGEPPRFFANLQSTHALDFRRGGLVFRTNSCQYMLKVCLV